MLWALSAEWYAGRLEPDYQPPSLDVYQAMLVRNGLRGDFWRLAG